MALDLADVARRAADLGGAEAIASVSLRRELVIACGPDSALRPPRRTWDLMVRLLVRDGAGRIGLARCSNSTSLEQLTTLAERARAQAAGSPIDLRPLAEPVQGASHEGYDDATAELELGRGVAAARAAASATEFALGRGRSATYRCEVVEFAIARSGGEPVTDRRTAAQVIARATDDEGRLIGHGQSSSPSAMLLDPVGAGFAATPPQLSTEQPSHLEVLRGSDYAVALRPAALAPLLCALADAACTGHAHATGTSPYTGRLGELVASSQLTLLDSPRYLHTLARAIDPEGVPAQAITLLEAGVAAGALHDTTSALEVGFTSTGHAAELGGSPAGAVARNLLLLPEQGGGHAEDLAARASGPVVVVPVVEHMMRESPVSSHTRAVGRAAYLVEDGLPIRHLGDVVLSADLAAVAGQIDALGGEGELVAQLSRLPERTRATHCPAALVRGIDVIAG